MTLSQDRLRKLLEPYGVAVDSRAAAQISDYLSLLMRWNEKINLTAIRSPEEMVMRHFGESFLASRTGPLHGRLLDIGSGAGFPGLALKIIYPELDVTLLEPVAKKRAFLREASRVCEFERVTVRGDRFQAFASSGEVFEAITARAVGDLDSLVENSLPMLSPSGRIYFWLSQRQAIGMRSNNEVEWIQEVDVPGSRERTILIGRQRRFR